MKKTNVLLLAAALVVATALPASAHVPVTPNVAKAGTKAELTFTVPNESATAKTVKVEIDMPTDTPFGAVDYTPTAGWSAQVTVGKLAKPIINDGDTITQAPTKIVYTADAGGGITDGQFENFVLSVDPVPDAGSVVLPVHQTYSDGTVVNWVDKTPASGEEPEHPAPTLYINDAPPTDDQTPGLVFASTSGSGVGSSSVSSSSTGMIFEAVAGLALVLGAAGFGLGLTAYLRSRRSK